LQVFDEVGIMFSRVRALLGAALFLGAVAAADAGPILNTAGQDLVATGSTFQAAFLHTNAGDTSVLKFSVGAGPLSGAIFQNNGVGATPVGTTLTLGSIAGGSLVFTLQDLTVPNLFSTGAASTNVNYVIFDGNITNLNNTLFRSPEALNAAGVAAVNALGAGALIIAFEDRPLAQSDRDFNDLIFGFKGVSRVPEPASMMLIGFALLSLFGFAVRRRQLGA